MTGTDFWTVLAILGMTAITVITRSFFFMSSRQWALPRWARRGLNYAPVAALAAVIVPELVMSHGALIGSLLDARLFGAAAGVGWYAWRRTVLGTIGAGMAIYMPLHIGLGI